jgi:hypothetical protein
MDDAWAEAGSRSDMSREQAMSKNVNRNLSDQLRVEQQRKDEEAQKKRLLKKSKQKADRLRSERRAKK